MREHLPKPPKEIDWDLEGEDLTKAIERHQGQLEVKQHTLTCPKGCFREDYPLYYHHPFRGLNSRPGDSWSISWVE